MKAPYLISYPPGIRLSFGIASFGLLKYITHIVLSAILGLPAGAAVVISRMLLESMTEYFEFRLIVAGLTRMFTEISREKGVISVIEAG